MIMLPFNFFWMWRPYKISIYLSNLKLTKRSSWLTFFISATLDTWVYPLVAPRSVPSFGASTWVITLMIHNGLTVIDLSCQLATAQCSSTHGSTLPATLFPSRRWRTSVATTPWLPVTPSSHRPSTTPPALRPPLDLSELVSEMPLEWPPPPR